MQVWGRGGSGFDGDLDVYIFGSQIGDVEVFSFAMEGGFGEFDFG